MVSYAASSAMPPLTYNILANANFEAIYPVGTLHLANQPNPKDGRVNVRVTALIQCRHPVSD